MKTLFEIGNQYLKECDWKDLAQIKFCLFSMGVMFGAQMSPKAKKAVSAVAAGVFAATYVPLMYKFAELVIRENAKEPEVVYTDVPSEEPADEVTEEPTEESAEE